MGAFSRPSNQSWTILGLDIPFAISTTFHETRVSIGITVTTRPRLLPKMGQFSRVEVVRV